jgi:hypothetical protein
VFGLPAGANKINPHGHDRGCSAAEDPPTKLDPAQNRRGRSVHAYDTVIGGHEDRAAQPEPADALAAA